MRPLTVLILVLGAIAALVFAIVSISGSPADKRTETILDSPGQTSTIRDDVASPRAATVSSYRPGGTSVYS